MNPEDLATQIEEWLASLRTTAGTEAVTTDAVADVVDTEALEGVTPDDYRSALEIVFNDYGVPEDVRQQVYDQLDAEGQYGAEGYTQNLTIVINDEDVNNYIDNSLTVEHGAEVHGDISQENETNVANATGDDSVAGRDQDGQFQTGDGVQVGDDNDGVVNQGDNSGQQAGDYAEADDITTGDGNFNNEGWVDDSAVAFGGGSADNQADDVYDESINDSFDTENSGNVDHSGNVTDSGNYESTYEATATAEEYVDVDVDASFNSDDDYKDVDNSHNEYEVEAGYEHEEPTYEDMHD